MVTDIEHRRNLERIARAIKASKVRFPNESKANVVRRVKKTNLKLRKLHLL